MALRHVRRDLDARNGSAVVTNEEEKNETLRVRAQRFLNPALGINICELLELLGLMTTEAARKTFESMFMGALSSVRDLRPERDLSSQERRERYGRWGRALPNGCVRIGSTNLFYLHDPAVFAKFLHAETGWNLPEWWVEDPSAAADACVTLAMLEKERT
jgi:hypothetical protein